MVTEERVWEALAEIPDPEIPPISIVDLGVVADVRVEGGRVDVIPLDSFNLSDVDLIQLDVEGYEWHALMGAEWTVKHNRPVIQLELRDFTQKYGHSMLDVREILSRWNYVEVSQQPGSDFVFMPKERVS